MPLKLLKYATLFLIMLNIPGWVLAKISPTYSSLLSYLSYGLMLCYFFLSKKWKLNVWMLTLGILYFGISSLSNQNFTPDEIPFIIIIIKYFITIIGGYALLQDTNKKELFYILALGAGTVFLQIFIYYDPITDGSRYSGFYLNPNGLGFICMMGYGLTYGLEKKWRLWGQIIFTFIGILTFSRTFVIVWLFMNLLSIRLSIKNIRILAIGAALLVGVIMFKSFLPKSNARLETLTNIFEGKSTNTTKLEEGGRSATWSTYYPYVFAKPIFGNGYGSFDGNGIAGREGAHNAYLKIVGEAGIICLLMLLLLCAKILFNSWNSFIRSPHLFMMTLALCLFLLTNHNFFDSSYVLFFTMWLQFQSTKEKKDSEINVMS